MSTYNIIIALLILSSACTTATATQSVDIGGCGGSQRSQQMLLSEDGGGGSGGMSLSASIATSTTSTGAEAQSCVDASDCKVFECEDAACTDGVCAYTKVASGTPARDQVPGDCIALICYYGPAAKVDNSDSDDLDDCTIGDACIDGVPHHTPVTAGAACTKGARCVNGKCS